MYQLRSKSADHRDGLAALRQELDALRQENAALQRYKAASQPILASIALNPFAEIDQVRDSARTVLSETQRRIPVATRASRRG